MNRADTIKMMSILRAAYPTYYRDMTRDDISGIVDLWQSMFAEDPAEVVASAVKAHIASDTKGFPPHIGAIKEAIRKVKTTDEMTEMEAWTRVQKAICNGYYNSKDEFEKLPETLQRLVGSANQLREWAMMDVETVNSVVASNFQRSYKARAASEREYQKLPGDVKQIMQSIAQQAMRPVLPDGPLQRTSADAPGELELKMLQRQLARP